MYLEHFGLQEVPFSLAPDPRYLYLSAQHREALAHLLYGVMSEGGFVQLTGEIGTGKTTVCRCFLERLPEGTEAAVILNPRLGEAELVAAICDEFRLPPGEGPTGVKASLDRLNAYLLDAHARGRRAVLVIDEAQNLDPGALELVRLLTNLETSRHKLLQIVLMGQPELRETLARPELRQLAQRITARFHLGPLSREEVGAYLGHRLGVAGCHERLFPPESVRLLRRQSGGVPRLINILADRALLGAYVQGLRQVDAVTVRQAAREVSGSERGRIGRVGRAAAVAAVVAAVTLAGLALLGRDAPAPPRVVTAAPAVEPETSAAQVAPPAAGPVAEPVVKPVVKPVARPVTKPVTKPVAEPVAEPAPVTPAVAQPGPAVPPALTALLQEPEARQQEKVLSRFLATLGIAWSGGGAEEICGRVRRTGLRCLRGGGDWRELLRLDRPGVVELIDEAGSAWILVEGQRGGQVTLAAGGARTVVGAERLAGYGVVSYVLAWKPAGATALEGE